MLIVCISDTHNQHSQVSIPECDILLHAGDFSGSGTISETKSFLEWFSKQPAKHLIFISGNHDWLDYNDPVLFKELLSEYPNVTYLRDESVIIEGLKIHGRPWTKEFCGWAFMCDPGSHKMMSTLSVIPSDTDILLTHGPALGILDRTAHGEIVGCEDLLDHLKDNLPGIKYVVVGHIHESAGQKLVGKTMHINAAVLNERYKYANKPIIIEIPSNS